MLTSLKAVTAMDELAFGSRGEKRVPARHGAAHPGARRVWRWVGNKVRSYATLLDSSLSRRDHTVAVSEKPPLGAHLVTPRIGYIHHGIYVGYGKVIHCGAVSRFLPRGPVEEVSLRDFCRRRSVAVRGGVPAKFTAQEVIDRAKSRLGEKRYRLLTNNCEHFCEWCLRGQQRSYQVERFTRWVRPLRAMSAGLPSP